MGKGFHLASLLAFFVAAAALTGCGPSKVGNDGPVKVSGGPRAGADNHDHSHEHGEKGPHGGHMIELGRSHRYHAELVENDATESITIYILDTHMEELAIGQPSLSLSLTANGASHTFELTAVTAAGATGSSRFESADKGLFQMLDQHGDVAGKLRVTIDGTPYVGTLDHDHDHSTHNH